MEIATILLQKCEHAQPTAEGARIAAIIERAAADIIRGETKNEDKTQADD